MKGNDGGSPSDNHRAKHIILLTDGMIEPWPGNEMRYGDTAAEYCNCVKNRNYRTCDKNFISKVKAIDTERLFERGGILETFRKNGWRIHCVGFSSGVDQEMLRRISEATYGSHGVAEDLTQLLDILDQIIPPAPNVVTLYVHNFCDTQRIEETVHIENDIQAVLFKIDLNKMLGLNTSVKAADITIQLTDPSGNIFSSTNNQFRFNTTDDGLVVSASYFKENPQVGDWTILVKGARDLCGKLKVTGRVPFVPEMRFVPEHEYIFRG